MIRWKGKKKMRNIILCLGVVILCGLVLMLSYYVKYQKDKDEKEREQQKAMEAALEWEKENEENYKKLEELFLENEEEFNTIVKELKKEKLPDKIANMFIHFRKDDWGKRDSEQEEVCFYKGELLENLEYCSQDTYDTIKNNERLYDALKKTEDKKTITGIIWTERMDEIDFGISPLMTPFITNNNGITNYFIYSEAEDCEKYGYKLIKDNWYMWITPRPE